MSTKNYNVASAAQMVGVSASTIRGWCSSFAEHLSESANPEAGKERRLTDHDIALLQAAKELRDQGQSVAEINQALGALPETGLQPFVDASVTPTNAPVDALQTSTDAPALPVVYNDLIDALRTLAPLASDLEEVKSGLSVLPAMGERLAKLEAKQEEDRKYRATYTMVFFAGAVAGLLFLLLLLALSVALK